MLYFPLAVVIVSLFCSVSNTDFQNLWCLLVLFGEVVTHPCLVGEELLIAVVVAFGTDAHEVLARLSRVGYALGVALEAAAVAAAYLPRLWLGYW